MSKNKKLHIAKKDKQDEFYTQLSDIENELKHYREQFSEKVVYCNCDDPKVSGFFYYFTHNFKTLGLKRLITTCYKNQSGDLFSQNDSEKAVYLDYSANDGLPDLEKTRVFNLEGNGDFRSQECVELLKQSDVVVTNPPFSLFREYISQLIDFEKKFLIIGPRNAICYKEIFPLIKENKLWLGHGFKSGNAYFRAKNHQGFAKGVYDEDTNLVKFRNVVWFTNIDLDKRHEELILFKKYHGNEHNYPKYDNYNAIDVGKIKEIPGDYRGVMGVPITFLDQYNPKQFEIIKFRKGDDNKDLSIDGKCPYFRILIKMR